MRLCFVADPHIRNFSAFGGLMVAGLNDRGRVCLQVMADAIACAEKKGCTDFVVLGDVFDQHNPPPQLVAALGDLLARSSMKIHLLVGNHDAASEEPGDHALGPLALAPDVQVYDRPAVNQGVLFVPFRRAPVTDWLDAELAQGAKRGAHVLAAHFGLIESGTPKFLQGATDAIESTVLASSLRKHGYDSAFLGNWHNPAFHRSMISGKTTQIQQCGTLIPKAFGDPRGGGVYFYDQSQSPPEKETVEAPDFVTVPWQDGAVRVAPDYMRVRDVPRLEADGLAAMLDEHVVNGAIKGYELEVISEAMKLDALNIGMSRATFSELIRKYIESVFKAESPEVRKELIRRLGQYGVL